VQWNNLFEKATHKRSRSKKLRILAAVSALGIFKQGPAALRKLCSCDMKTTGFFACLSPSSQISGMSSAASTLASCGHNPDRYAKEMERHFSGDMAKLYAYVEQQPAEQQKAIIDGSKALRDFLGIRSPNNFRKKLSCRSSSFRIEDCEAPTALAMVATRSGNDARVLRSLARLDEVLKNHLLGQHVSNEFQRRIEAAFSKLLQEFHELRTEAAQQKVLELIEQHLPPLNRDAWENISLMASNAMEKPGISNEIKNRLLKLREKGANARPSALTMAEGASQARQDGNRGKAGFANILRSSATTHFQGKNPNSASRSSDDTLRLSENKQKFLDSGNNLQLDQQSDQISDSYESVRLSITDISSLAKAYSQKIGSPIHVSGNVIPITEELREAWRARQEEFFDDLISSPEAGVRMLHRYIEDFRNDKALKDFHYISWMHSSDLDPARLSQMCKAALTEVIDANTDGIRDRLLARVKKEREELSNIAKHIGYGAERAAEELTTIANNTGGVAHGYIFPTVQNSIFAPGHDMHVIPSKGHVESYVVSSTGKVINIIPYWDRLGARPELKGQYSADVTPFLVNSENLILPQAGRDECGTMSLSYLKQYLKCNAEQLNNNTLLLDLKLKSGHMHYFHLPSPQVLKYSQSNLYVKVVRAIIAGNEDVVTVVHKDKNITVRTLQGLLKSEVSISRPDGMEIPGGIEQFRKSWVDLCDISDARRSQMRVEGRNLYASYASQRLQKKAKNIAE